MVSTEFLIQLGLMAATIIVVLIIGYIKPHQSDLSTDKSQEKWVIPPTLFRYVFWFGILACLIMAMSVTDMIY